MTTPSFKTFKRYITTHVPTNEESINICRDVNQFFNNIIDDKMFINLNKQTATIILNTLLSFDDNVFYQPDSQINIHIPQLDKYLHRNLSNIVCKYVDNHGYIAKNKALSIFHVLRATSALIHIIHNDLFITSTYNKLVELIDDNYHFFWLFNPKWGQYKSHQIYCRR